MSDARFWRIRSLGLLLALVVAIVLNPLLSHQGRPAAIGLGLLVLLAAVRALAISRRSLVLALALGLPVAVSIFFVRASGLGVSTIHALQVTFLILVLGALLRSLFQPGEIGVDRIANAAAAYLLIGNVWAHLYSFAEAVYPGSFIQGSGEALTFNDLLYFSYVTMTTLGYGDITPTHGFARSLVVLEATFGTFYMAIVIAGLVSRYRRHQGDGD